MHTDVEKSDEAAALLTHVMSFFPRVDGRLTFVLGLDLGLLALLAANASPLSLATPPLIVATVFGLVGALGLSISAGFVLHGFFPRLDGGQASLIYFRSIASMTESDFLARFQARSVGEHRKDLLAQVHRNSQILKVKYDALKTASWVMLLSFIPWFVALVILVTQSTRIQLKTP